MFPSSKEEMESDGSFGKYPVRDSPFEGGPFELSSFRHTALQYRSRLLSE